MDGILIDGMTQAQCRDAKGQPSVTTVLEYWSSPSLMFWKIGENVEASYEILDMVVQAQPSLEEYVRMVADQYYKTHRYLANGTMIHNVMDRAIKDAVLGQNYMEFYESYAEPAAMDFIYSCSQAYQWFEDKRIQVESEIAVYDEEKMVAGTADISGMIYDKDGREILGGADWKGKDTKHPGLKKDGTMRTIKAGRTDAHLMQLGAYGRVLGWQGAWLIYISTNPMVHAYKAIWYSKEDLDKGYVAYGYLRRAYKTLFGF